MERIIVKPRLGRYLLAAVITVAYAAFAGCDAAPPNEPPEVVFVSPGPDGYGTLTVTSADLARKKADEEARLNDYMDAYRAAMAARNKRSKK